jgi:hypothetical protein
VSDSMRFERVEGKAAQAPAVEAQAVGSGAPASKSGRRK